MKTILKILALLLIASPCLAVDLVLHNRIASPAGVVRLGDVAAIDNATQEEAARLAAIPLMPAPSPGTESFITVRGVRDLLVASGVELNTLRFTGATKVAIGDKPRNTALGNATPRSANLPADRATPPSTFVSKPHSGYRSMKYKESTAAPLQPRYSKTSTRSHAGTLHARDAKQLTETLTQSLTEFAQIESGIPMLHVLSPEIETRHLQRLATATTKINITSTTNIVEGRQRFLVSFGTAEGEVRFPVFAEIKPARPAVFVTRSIPRGAVVTAADVELRPLPLDYRLPANETAASSLDDVIGQEAATSLRTDSVLTDGNCLPPTMVKRGDAVSVLAGGGGIRIRLQAKAKTDGRLGETIEVQTLDTRERLIARVVGRRELAVLTAGVGAVDYVAGAKATEGRNVR